MKEIIQCLIYVNPSIAAGVRILIRAEISICSVSLKINQWRFVMIYDLVQFDVVGALNLFGYSKRFPKMDIHRAAEKQRLRAHLLHDT